MDVYCLPLNIFQLLFDLFTTHLCIANGGLNSWSPPLGDMAQVIGHFLQRPASFPCPVCEIMAQIVKGDLVDGLCLLASCLFPFQLLPPVLNPILGPAI